MGKARRSCGRFPSPWPEGMIFLMSSEPQPDSSPGELPSGTSPYISNSVGPNGPSAITTPGNILIPGYELLEELGRGGMGVVYKARHLKLDRLVAVKVLPNAAFASPGALARFLIEAQVVAKVKHPNVVEIYDFGEVNQAPYFVLELLSPDHFGKRYPRKGWHDLQEIIRVLAKVAHGVAEVHAEGMVHRDLKPANILFDKRGEPKVVDFGLAKRENSLLTKSDDIFGTLHYMAPEQARGKAKQAGPATDVWAIGVILYECLTGCMPFDADEQIPLLLAIVNDEPRIPRNIAPNVPLELETIVLKCLSKKSEDRYATAKELAETLDQYSNNLRIIKSASPPESSASLTNVRINQPFQDTVQRLPGAPSLARRLTRKLFLRLISLLSFLIVPFIVTGLNAFRSLDRQQSGSSKVDKEFEIAGKSSSPQLSSSPPAKTPSLSGGIPNPLQQVNSEWKVVLALRGHTDTVYSASFSLDGSRMVTASGDQTAIIWDAKSGMKLRPLNGHTNIVWSASFSPDGAQVVTASSDCTAIIWDANTGEKIRTLIGHTYMVCSASFSPDGAQVVTASGDNSVATWDVKTGERIHVYTGHTETVCSASFSPDGTQVVTASWDKTAIVWDTKTGEKLRTFKGHTAWLRCASFSSDGLQIATASDDKTTIVWDVKTGGKLYSLNGHTSGVCSAKFSLDRSRLITASWDETAIVWDAKTGEKLHSLQWHIGGVRSAAFNRPSSRIITASGDGTAAVWEVLPPQSK